MEGGENGDFGDEVLVLDDLQKLVRLVLLAEGKQREEDLRRFVKCFFKHVFNQSNNYSK